MATENNTVYALNAADDSVAWHANLGTAVVAATLPCGRLTISWVGGPSPINTAEDGPKTTHKLRVRRIQN